MKVEDAGERYRVSIRSLLDINVLIALLDRAHVHHFLARAWLEANIDGGWASCPTTQNGFVRIISQPAYPQSIPPALAIARLRGATATAHHVFWNDDLSVLDPEVIEPERVHGPRQLTDMYLLALAVRNGGRFVTFDTAIAVAAVPGARAEHLVVL